MAHGWAAQTLALSQTVLILLCFRTAPMVGWLAFMPRQTLGARTTGAVTFGILMAVAAQMRGAVIGHMLVGYAYFAALGCCVPKVTSLVRRGHMTYGAAFALCAIGFFVLPSVLVRPAYVTALLVIGWDLMLSAYSYCVEVSKSKEERGVISDCLFFLLVNPALVYSSRGARIDGPGWNAAGCSRALRGVFAVSVAGWFFGPGRAAVVEGMGNDRLVPQVVIVSLSFFCLYLQHSGLASLQIGTMRQLGYVIPERYVAPLTARNPLEFWRRWNTYVGGWMQRYVFWPLSLRMRRNTRSRVIADVVAIIVTFGVVGILHDVTDFAHSFRIETVGLQAFTLGGVLLLVWVAVERVTALRSAGRSVFASDLGSGLSRILFWSTMLALYGWWT